MATDQKHSSDSIASEQEVIRYTKILAQAFGLNEQNAEVYSVLSSENRVLAKRLDHYCSRHRKLKKRVKLLEERVKWLDDNVDELFTMEHCNCSKESTNSSFENMESDSSSSSETSDASDSNAKLQRTADYKRQLKARPKHIKIKKAVSHKNPLKDTFRG
jgi:uncharacterized protein YciW